MADPQQAILLYAQRRWAAFSVRIDWEAPGPKSEKGRKKVQPVSSWRENAGAFVPGYNAVGIDTGASGLVVVDFDGPPGLEMENRLREHLPDFTTLTAVSGSGGAHWYFLADPDRPLSNRTNVPLFDKPKDSRVDVRSQGGFILAPPSAYRDHLGHLRQYRWDDPDAQPIPIPPELLDLLSPASRKRAPGPALQPAPPDPAAAPPDPAAAPPDPAAAPPDAAFATAILAALDDSRADDYATWVKTGIALKRAGHGLALWDAFSRRSPRYRPDEVRAAWDSFDVSQRDGAVGLGSVVAMAREDDPARTRLAIDASRHRAAPGPGRGRATIDQAAVLELLSSKLPKVFPPGAADATVSADGSALTIASGDNRAVVRDNFDVFLEDAFVGNLLTDAELDLGPLGWVHSSIPSDATNFRFGRTSKNTITLTSVGCAPDTGAALKLTESAVGRSVLDVQIPGMQKKLVHRPGVLRQLNDVMTKAMQLKAKEHLGAIYEAINLGALVNNGVQNIVVNQVAPEDDAGACETFLAWLQDEGYRPVSCGGRLVMYDPEDGIYHRPENADLRRILRKAGTSQVGEYACSSTKQDALFKQIDALAPRDPDFFERADASAKRRLAFANGVWDFEHRELLPFSPDIVLFHKLPHRFPESEEELRLTRGLADEIARRVVDPIWTQSAEFVMQNTARAAAGELEDRTYHFGIGETASGKGVWMDIVAAALTDRQVGVISSGNVLWQRRTGDQAKNNSWLCSIRDNLINFTSEMQIGPGVYVDGNRLKELSSGGERLHGRQNNQDEYSFKLRGLTWSFANDVPPIKPTDSAVKNRVRFIPMQNTFLLGAEYEARKGQPGVLLGDENIKQWVRSPEVGAAFAWMLTQTYVPHKVDVPPHISVETKEWIQDSDQDDLLSSIVQRGGPDDFVTCKELFEAAKAAGMEVSQVKLGRLMEKRFAIRSRNRGASAGRGFEGVTIIHDY